MLQYTWYSDSPLNEISPGCPPSIKSYAAIFFAEFLGATVDLFFFASIKHQFDPSIKQSICIYSDFAYVRFLLTYFECSTRLVHPSIHPFGSSAVSHLVIAMLRLTPRFARRLTPRFTPRLGERGLHLSFRNHGSRGPLLENSGIKTVGTMFEKEAGKMARIW